jgi:hypothetical protein
MDFLGFLKGENYFLEFLNKRIPPPPRLAARDPRIADAAGIPAACAAARPATGQPQPIRRQAVWLAAV